MNGSIKDTARILIVDDQPYNVDLLKRILRRDGYKHLQGLEDPTLLEEVFHQYEPDIILLDIHMPEINGLDALQMIRRWQEDNEYLPILILTADMTPEIKQNALSAGANDFLNKPFDRTEVLLRIHNLLETRNLHKELQHHNEQLENKVKRRTQMLEQAQNEILTLLAKVSEFRDDVTGKHTKRVGLLSELIAMELGLPEKEIELIGKAAPLHDIGKVAVPDRILLKPGRFTEDEFKEMQKHTVFGEQILVNSQFDILRMAEQISASHHEKWDGTGYPNGLKGEHIPLPARIVAVADFYDALTHHRPYKDAWSQEATLEEIKNQKGKHFDPVVADACIAVIQQHKYIEPNEYEE
jgi:Response regulator containing a CheY-like receiver domain and an HD-GYP domain